MVFVFLLLVIIIVVVLVLKMSSGKEESSSSVKPFDIKSNDSTSSTTEITRDHKSLSQNAVSIWNSIPPETRNLIYTSTDPAEDIGPGFTLSMQVDIDRGTVVIDEIQQKDPSTVFFTEPISVPNNPGEVERPSYFPSYVRLSPAQKWLYLNWLRDVDQTIDIGFVFIFYYGLERRLLLDDFDSVFDMILRLRRSHHNSSFQSYSIAGLVYGVVYRNRPDRLSDLLFTLEEHPWGNEQLLICSKLGKPITAENLISVIEGITDLNRRYIKNNPEEYQEHLSDLLTEQYGVPELDLQTYFPFLELERHSKILFANYTFPEEVRNPEIPDYIQDSRFKKLLVSLHETTHERTKESLKVKRKKETT